MSSWSSYPPPPRRSRSRSPSRGGYSGRPYPDSYPEGYRDWEYDRERWGYERDRMYDYGRRGRSRSPPTDEGMSLVALCALFSKIWFSWQKTTTIDVSIRQGAVRPAASLQRRLRFEHM